MSDSTNIEWADATWNPITGCTPVSEGCEHCYAAKMAKRLAGRAGYPKEQPFAVAYHIDKFAQPCHWKKPRRIFTCSMGDLWHRDVANAARGLVMHVIEKCPRHTFLCLTKRPELVSPQWSSVSANGSNTGAWPENVWLGVTAENQRRLLERVPYLLDVKAALHFVSMEPLLGAIDLDGFLPGESSCVECGYTGNRFGVDNYCQECGERMTKEVCKCGGDAYDLSCPRCGAVSEFGDYGCEGVYPLPPSLDWLIVGSETGPGRRPCELDWVKSLIEQADTAGVPVFVKQLEINGQVSKDMSEWPAWARHREFPSVRIRREAGMGGTE